ncbi:hypothetical protein [Hydrogenophaga sp.]|uniref:hypothetical protein n=1 Tax=Hydrogenophaga sp. TaxID=1904254 RepID=UPI003F702FC8
MTTFTPEEQALEQHIKDCGFRMSAAYAAQDFDDARRWQARMYDAINSRSSEHRAKRYAQIDSAIWFQSPEALELGKAPHA